MQNGLYILGQLTDEDVEWMVSAGKRRDLAAGTVLIHEGMPTDSLYLVLNGALSISLATLGGKEIDTKGPGEIVGEMSFIDARPPSATVSARQPAVVFALDRAKMRAKLEQDTAFAAHFYRSMAIFLSDRLRHTLGLLNAGGNGSGTTQIDDDDELDLNVLDNVHLAGARFTRILQRFTES